MLSRTAPVSFLQTKHQGERQERSWGQCGHGAGRAFRNFLKVLAVIFAYILLDRTASHGHSHLQEAPKIFPGHVGIL